MKNKILVIDHDKHARLIIDRNLKKLLANSDITIVTSLKEIKQDIGNFSLIIMDVYLPGCDTFEFITKTKSQYPKMKIIVATATYTRDTQQKLEKIGIDYFLPKPFRLEELKNALTTTESVN